MMVSNVSMPLRPRVVGLKGLQMINSFAETVNVFRGYGHAMVMTTAGIIVTNQQITAQLILANPLNSGNVF